MEGVFTYFGVIFGHEGSGLMMAHVILVAIIMLVLARVATKNMQAVPSGSQNVMEAYLGGVIAMGKDVIGEENARKYLPLVATLGLFVFFSNLIGIIPGFESPTSNINITLTLALLVFVYYHFEGVRAQGLLKYLGSFVHLGEMNPILKGALTAFMYPIEIISHISRIISLSFRLFGNIKGDDLFLWVLLMLAPFAIVPLSAYVLLTFGAILQSFIFMILTYVYLAGAVLVSEEHH
jgi:F-type H+-transporting ATPase subunit a